MWELVGWGGALLVLAAYALMTAGRLMSSSARFHWLNFIGAAGLAANGLVHRAWPVVGLEGLWAAIAGIALARLAFAGKRAR